MRDAQRRLDATRLAADRKEALENEQIDILTRDLNDANRRVVRFSRSFLHSFESAFFLNFLLFVFFPL